MRKTPEQKIENARASQNALDYVLLCEETGNKPTDKYLYEKGEADIIEDDKETIRDLITHYKIILEQANRFYPRAHKVCTEEKVDLLKKFMGYTHLKIKGGRAYIENCKPKRIGIVFEKEYNEVVKDLEFLENNQ